MKILAGAKMWRVRMKSGQTIGVWAGAVGEDNGNYVFDVYVEATDVEQKENGMVITANTPANPKRVMIAVASIPIEEVEDVEVVDWDKIPEPLVNA